MGLHHRPIIGPDGKPAQKAPCAGDGTMGERRDALGRPRTPRDGIPALPPKAPGIEPRRSREDLRALVPSPSDRARRPRRGEDTEDPTGRRTRHAGCRGVSPTIRHHNQFNPLPRLDRRKEDRRGSGPAQQTQSAQLRNPHSHASGALLGVHGLAVQDANSDTPLGLPIIP